MSTATLISQIRRICIPLALIFAAMAYFSILIHLEIYGLSTTNSKGALTDDAHGFYKLALLPNSFYDASIREPLFTSLVKVTIIAFGNPTPDSASEILNNHTLIRYLTGTMGIILIGLIGACGWVFCGPYTGCLAAWFYVTSSYSSFYAISGLRQTFSAVLVMALTLVIAIKPHRKFEVVIKRVFVITLCCAMPLNRLSSLAVVALIVFANLIYQRLVLKAAFKNVIIENGLCLVICVAVLLPFCINCKREYGYYLYPLHVHSTYWKNHEFAGQSGFAAREDVLKNPHHGELVTIDDYVFKYHTLPEIALRYFEAYALCLFEYLPRIYSTIIVHENRIRDYKNHLYWFWLPGLCVMVYSWRKSYFLIVNAWASQFPFAFILPLNTVLPGQFTDTGVQLRFSMPLATYIAVVAAAGIVVSFNSSTRVLLRKIKS